MSADLLSRVPEWLREAERFEQKARALRQMADAVKVLNGDAARLFALDGSAPIAPKVNQYATDEGPRGREAVRRIVADRPGEWFIRDIKKVNREKGWPSNDVSIETAVSRMAAAGEARKLGRKGLYWFGPETGTDMPLTNLQGTEG